MGFILYSFFAGKRNVLPMKMPNSVFIAAALLFLSTFSLLPKASGLGGSGATIAVVFGSATTVCTIAAGNPVHRIHCWSNGRLLPPLLPSVSFEAISGGRDTLCGVRSGGLAMLCWNAVFTPRRIYINETVTLTSLVVGGSQICGLRNVTGRNFVCWRGNFLTPSGQLRVISSGLRFSCGVTVNNQALCWGDEDDGISRSIQSQFENISMVDIQVGGSHACGFNNSGFIVCRGDNSHGQINVPENLPFHYRSLSLGENHSCAITRLDRTVVCWGGNGAFSSNITDGVSFVSIASGLDFNCGVTTGNLSVICWGPGWPRQYGFHLPFNQTLPVSCVSTPCECNVYPQSQNLCAGNGQICNPCENEPVYPPPVVSSSPSSPSRGLRTGLLAFAIVGSVGFVAGICSLIYCLWTSKKKIHNTVQPRITGSNSVGHQSRSSPLPRSSTSRSHGSILMRRQRSGTSKHADKLEEFPLTHLSMATNDFSTVNKIGAGSFGVVYSGKLNDGRQVAIKRSELGKKGKFQEKETAFESELEFMSRVHHKNLVRLLGFCEERDERMLVYEFMKNGALYEHLHGEKKSSRLVDSWKMRIKICLDAARGIEYLHSYAVPPIIHRDIKSSNILIDESWIGKVSDFGLSMMGPEKDDVFRPMKAAGTVGYIDPEYYALNVLTAKSDVYGFGVVLLELVTGKRAIFRNGEDGTPISVVDFAVPVIMTGEVSRIVDPRVGMPETDAEAVELVAYTAIHCVNLEGKDRPTMGDVVGNLEQALALCSDGGGSCNEIYSD